MLLAHMEDAEKLPKIKPHCTTTSNVHGLNDIANSQAQHNRSESEGERKRCRVGKPDIDEPPGCAKGAFLTIGSFVKSTGSFMFLKYP
jgi:hypothetical protein